MKILLLTRNHVVKEFVSLVADRVSAKLFVVDNISDVKPKRYDFMFVDDGSIPLEQSIEMMEELDRSICSVLLYSRDSDQGSQFDIMLKKPFLPSDIQNIIEDRERCDGDKSEREYLSSDQILNLQDIEEIKTLLDSDELEIVPEEILADEIDKATKNREQSSELQNGDGILDAILAMDHKRLRKLLAGAEVSISIKFPEGEER